MWHLNIILPLTAAAVLMVVFTVILCHLLINAIIDGTVKKTAKNETVDIGTDTTRDPQAASEKTGAPFMPASKELSAEPKVLPIDTPAVS